MQKEITSSLKMIIAKLELKQLEFIDKLSLIHNDYVIRCITCPDTNEFLAVNGDWERVTDFKEKDCVGKKWGDFISKPPMNIVNSDDDKNTDDFDSFVCDVVKKDGTRSSVNWKSKFFPEINAVVSIGRAKK